MARASTPSAGESDTGNNCSIGVRVVVSSSSDDHGDTRATATPIGSNSSTPGTLNRGDLDYFRLVLSARTTLTAESTGNTDTVGQLEASDGSVIASNDDGAGSGVNFRIREEVSAGTYYIQVRGYSPDDAGPYTLVVSSAGTPSEIPDLVVESPAVSSGAVAPDESFTLSATVRNQGAGAAGSTTLRYYQSRDSTITTGDTGVGTDAVPALTGNRTSSESISLRVVERQRQRVFPFSREQHPRPVVAELHAEPARADDVRNRFRHQSVSPLTTHRQIQSKYSGSRVARFL